MGALFNPDADNLYTLPEAFNALGSKRHREAWTGREITARQLPDPDKILPAVRAEIRVAKALMPDAWPRTFTLEEGVREGIDGVEARWRAEGRARLIDGLVRGTKFSREAVTAALHPTTYRAEFQAFQRRTRVEREIPTMFYNGAVGAELLNAVDGTRPPIPARLWLAEMFKISFSTGMAEWRDRSLGTTYRGLVLIERRRFDLAVKSLTSAEESGTSRKPGAETTSRIGRPTYKDEIKAAYRALASSGAIDFKAPKNKMYGPIRDRVRIDLGEPNLVRGLGDEAIRATVRELFDADKSRKAKPQ